MTTKYEVTIVDSAENCEEVLLSETYSDLETAQSRFDALREEFLNDPSWREGLDLWLFEVDGDESYSIDGESK